MQVLYRITDIPSTNPSPILQEDKPALNRLCLRSFVKAFETIQPTITFLCDYVHDYSFLEVVPYPYTIIKSKAGINQTMLDSYTRASKMDDYILFSECDYLWTENAGKILQEGIRELPIVSPYDHPDFYSRFDIHDQRCEIKVVNGYHYRTATRNTMTWATHSDIVKKNLATLLKYGYLDNDVWFDLSIDGFDLFTPIPGVATHMVKTCLSFGTDWSNLWRKYL